MEDLASLTERAELKLILDYIITDFYTIKEMDVYLEIEYSDEIQKLIDSTGFSDAMFIISNVDLLSIDEEGQEFSVAQFFPQTRQIGTLGPNGIIYPMSLYPPFRKDLYGMPVGDLKVTSIRFRESTKNEYAATRQLKAYDFVKSIDIRFTINGVSVLTESIDDLDFIKEPYDDGGYLVFAKFDLEEKLKEFKTIFEEAVTSRLKRTKQEPQGGNKESSTITENNKHN